MAAPAAPGAPRARPGPSARARGGVARETASRLAPPLPAPPPAARAAGPMGERGAGREGGGVTCARRRTRNERVDVDKGGRENHSSRRAPRHAPPLPLPHRRCAERAGKSRNGGGWTGSYRAAHGGHGRAQSPVQPGPPHSGGVTASLGTLATLTGKNFLLNTQSNAKFEAVPPHPVTPCSCKRSLSVLPAGSPEALEGNSSVTPSCLKNISLIKSPKLSHTQKKQPPSSGREERLYFHDKRLYKVPSKYNVFHVLAFTSGNPMEFHTPARSPQGTRPSAMGDSLRFPVCEGNCKKATETTEWVHYYNF